jgi:hypothetical protein
MLRWGGIQEPSAIFGSKVSEMAKLPTGDGQNTKVPEVKPQAAAATPTKRRGPGKSRSQAWAKIDAGKGTWKPK